MKNFISSISNNKIGSTASKIFALQIAAMLIAFIPSILISRALGPELKGKYDLFMLLTTYITEFGMIGFGGGLLYYQLRKKNPLREINGTAIVFSVGMGLLICGVGILSVNLWRGAFAGLSQSYIMLALLIGPALIYRVIFGNLMLGEDRAIVSYQITLVVSLIDFVFILSLYFLSCLGYVELIYLYVIETVAFSVFGYIYIYRMDRGFSFNLQLMNNSIRYGLVLFIGGIANSILFKIDVLFVNYYCGNRSVGLYNVAVRWAEMLFLLDGAINASTIYRVGTLKKKEAIELSKKTMKIQFLVSSIGAMAMAIAAYPIVKVLYGNAYMESIFPLLILLPGIVLWSTGKIASQYIVYQEGKAKYCTYAAIVGAFTNIILNRFWVPRYGINGAAVSSLVSYTIVIILMLLLMKKFVQAWELTCQKG